VVTPLTGGSPLPVSGRQIIGSELKVRGLSGAGPDVERVAARRRHLRHRQAGLCEFPSL